MGKNRSYVIRFHTSLPLNLSGYSVFLKDWGYCDDYSGEWNYYYSQESPIFSSYNEAKEWLEQHWKTLEYSHKVFGSTGPVFTESISV